MAFKQFWMPEVSRSQYAGDSTGKANSQAQVPLYKRMETERAKLSKSVGNIAAPMEGESNLLDQHYRRPVKCKCANPL